MEDMRCSEERPRRYIKWKMEMNCYLVEQVMKKQPRDSQSLWALCEFVIKMLADEKEFHLTDDDHMIIADDNVWINYCKDHPYALKLRHLKYPFLDDMRLILELEDYSNGKEGFSDESVSENEGATSHISPQKKMKTNGEGSFVWLESVVKAAQELPDMDDEFLFDTCDFLRDQENATIFTALAVEQRRMWLHKKLRPYVRN